MNETSQQPEWCRVRPGEEADPIALKVPLRESMRRYVERGVPEGSFVEAVIAGDLFEAAARADSQNQHLLWQYVYWFHTYAPRGCYGSERVYRKWLAMHKAARHWQRQQPEEILGHRVCTLIEFAEVPVGTEGVIDQLYDNGVMVAWDLPGYPLPPGYSYYAGQTELPFAFMLRDGVSLEELRFLTPVEGQS